MEITDIQLKSSPLYHFLEITEFYIRGSASWPEFDEALKTVHREMTTLGERYAGQVENHRQADRIEVILDLLERALGHIEELEAMHKENVPGSEMAELAEELEEINLELALLKSEVPPAVVPAADTDASLNEEQLLALLSKRVGEEMATTSNYAAIEQAAASFLSQEIPLHKYLASLDKMQRLVNGSVKDLETFSHKVDNWTTEMLLQKKLLADGFTGWQEALEILRSAPCLEDRDEETVADGVAMAFDANRKLVMVQELTRYVKKREEKK